MPPLPPRPPASLVPSAPDDNAPPTPARTRQNPPRRDCLRAYFLQISILANHQNGRDCHVRQIRVFGPRRDPLQLPTQPLQFTSQEFREFVSVR